MKRSTPMKRSPFKPRTEIMSRKVWADDSNAPRVNSAPKRKVWRAKPDAQMIKWTSAVRQRDNYHCQFPGCNYVSRSIHAHHILTRSQRPDRKYDVEVGISLCHVHHQFVHDNPVEATAMKLLGGETYEVSRK